jgi:hypothetical protein
MKIPVLSVVASLNLVYGCVTVSTISFCVVAVKGGYAFTPLSLIIISKQCKNVLIVSFILFDVLDCFLRLFNRQM